MSYELDAEVRERLVALPENLDPEVHRVEVALEPDHYGEDALMFRVILKDTFKLEPRSARIGAHLQRIAAGLRRRMAENDVPLFAYIRFVLRSEAGRVGRRRTA